ncbi:MAG: secretin N-terminal domain-containing protein [Planctomycetota bacterium]|nr:secretin N-terminal domain-containing protein [Planctomycetota bacterium]
MGTQATRRGLKGLIGIGAIGVFVAAILLTPGSFQDPTGITWADDGDEMMVLNIGKDEVEMEAFLRVVSKATKQPLVWNPADKNIRGKKIIGSVDIRAPKSELFNLVRALLTFYELVMIPVGPEDYKVQLVMDARQTSSILKLKPDYVKLTQSNLNQYENADGKFITTTIRVENMTDLRNARNALTRIVTGQNIGNVTEVPAANAFVVTDFAPNVVAIYRLLQEMDVKPSGKELISEYVMLEYAVAEEIEPILTDLFTGRDRVSARPTTGRRTPSSSANTTDDPEPRIISDPRTNKIILYGIKDDLDEIKKVISNLDVQVYVQNDRVHVVRLKNLEAEDTAEVLSTLIEAASIFGTSTATTGTGGRTRPGSTQAPRNAREEEKPAVVADVKSNSLIIAATKRQFEELSRVIEEIDIKKDQVLIEAALIELTLDDSFRLAIELGLADDNGLVGNDEVSGFGFTSFGQTVFADKDGDTFFTDRIPPFVDSGDNAAPTGLVGGIFAFGQVPLVFNVLNSVTQSRILQLPSLVTADNEEAVIEVKEEQAFTTSSTTTGGVTSGGLGGFESAGTTLRISPHISDARFLLLNISLTVEAFVGEPRVLSSGDVIPADKITRQLTTAVTCPDRHTVVLGGLMGRNQRSTVDKTPYLADIPILGEAFKSTNKSDRETSLFLFVTPTIMAGDKEGFTTLDIESCKRKQKADELIGFTEIYNSNFVNCDLQDPATGAFTGARPGAVRGSGSASGAGRAFAGRGSPGQAMPRAAPGGATPSERFSRIGLLEATRFSGVSRERLEAEKAARRAALVRGSGAAVQPVRGR